MASQSFVSKTKSLKVAIEFKEEDNNMFCGSLQIVFVSFKLSKTFPKLKKKFREQTHLLKPHQNTMKNEKI